MSDDVNADIARAIKSAGKNKKKKKIYRFIRSVMYDDTLTVKEQIELIMSAKKILKKKKW